MRDLVITIVVALAGAVIADRLKVPAGSLVGAMVAVAIFNVVKDGRAVELPGGAQFLAFAALGWAIGATVTGDTLRTLQRSAVPLLFVVVALLLFGGLLAVIATRAGWMDSTTAFLAASPGALSQMSALAAALGANAALVAAVHTVRLVGVILISPVVARIIAG